MVDFAKLLREKRDKDRALLYHAESDSYVECASEREASRLMNASYDGSLCIDVTGIPHHEARFKQQERKMNARTRVKPAVESAHVPAQDEPLHVKYRPRVLKDVIGQDAAVKSIKAALSKPTKPHAYLLTGPSGTGKTTLARIIAGQVGCDPNNVIEVDAASNSGIDAMRELVSGLRYHGFGEQPNKAFIIDEAHALSKAAWQSLLKPIEEPPPHVYFFILTTETGKVPETIVTRCANYQLKSVRYDDIMDLLELVADAERLDVNPKIMQAVARACDGSPRKALVMLAMVQDCEDEGEAERLLESPLENKEIIDLCRLLIRQDLTWQKLTQTLRAMPDMTAESARIVIVNYLASCAMGAKSEKEAARLCDLMYEFRAPFATTDKMAPLLLAFGNLLFN